MKKNFLEKMMEFSVKTLMALLFIFVCEAQAASNQSLVYQGRVVRPDGKTPNSGSIGFSLSLYSPLPARCLLYSENQTVDMTGSQGMFSLQLGAGTRTDTLSHSFNQVFINGGALSGLTCANGDTSYSPSSTDDRDLVVVFNDAGTSVQLSAMSIKSVPFALQAHEIDGWGVNNLVKVSSIGSPTTFTTAEMAVAKTITGLACASNEIIKWNGTAWACAADAIGAAPGDASYAAKGIVQFDTDAATSGISVTTGVAKLSNTGVTAATYGSATAVPSIAIDAQGRITSAASTAIAIPASQLTQSGATTGQVLKWNGTAWAPDADLGTTTDASYVAKGIVQIDTDAATSGLSIATGILKLATSGVTAGTYKSVTVDAFGRVTGGTNPTTLADYGITDAVKNNGGAVSLQENTAASRPAAGTAGALYFATDTKRLSRDNGTGWDALSIDASDLTTGVLSIAQGGTGASTLAGNRLIGMNGTGTAQQAVTCAQNQVLSFDGTGAYGCYNVGSIFAGFVNSGNSFAVDATLGTNDAFALNFETNNVAHMALTAAGNFGIGTSTPNEKFEVLGSARLGQAPATLTTLSVAATATDTTLTVVATTDYPSSGTLLVDNEAILYTGKTGTTFTGLIRGVFGTAAAAHASSAVVNNYLTLVGGSPTLPKMIVTGDGRVGIGTVSPNSSQLHVVGNTRMQGETIVENLDGASRMVFSNYNVELYGAPQLMFGAARNFSHPSAGDPLGEVVFMNTMTWNQGARITSIATENHSATVSGAELSLATTPNGTASPVQRMVIAQDGNVGIGTAAPSQKLEVDGGVRLNTTTAKPICDASTRGTFWVTQAGAGVKDSVEVCAKDAADAMAWRTLY